jgi:hypothetical protein
MSGKVTAPHAARLHVRDNAIVPVSHTRVIPDATTAATEARQTGEVLGAAARP